MDKSSYGRTVFLLGADASCHTGAPLLADFLVQARRLCGRGGLTYQSEFEKAFAWIDHLRSSAYYIDLDLSNIEHVFSMAALAQETGDPKGEEILDALRKIIWETLDKSIEVTKEGLYTVPDPPYEAFCRSITGGKTNSRAPSLDHAVITMNYDVVLDDAMQHLGIPVSYGLSSEKYPTGFPVLKLHGSHNWAFCTQCSKGAKRIVHVVPPSPLPPGHAYVDQSSGLRVSYPMVTQTLAKTKCPICSTAGTLSPAVIPPTWSKMPTQYGFDQVWRKAIDVISNASQLVIIGYSMPPTDTFISYLLALGLLERATLSRVVVVNPDERAEERYKEVFSRGVHGRGQLRFVKKTFQGFLVVDHEGLHLGNILER
ncbi:MAG: hypothetical protein V2A58_12530 [Planctomycetota bacterium]